MELIRDILDKALLDPTGEKLGRVDGIILELRPDGPPRVVALESSGESLLRRLHPALARLGAKLRTAIMPADAEPLRVPWSKVRCVDVEVEVDVDAEQASSLAWERWLSSHVIGRIPGA